MADKFFKLNITEMRETFALFDKNGDGKITEDEVKIVYKSLGRSPSHEGVLSLIAKVDRDGSGDITFTEFVDLLTGGLEYTHPQEELIEAFRAFDKNKDGYISASELVAGMKKMLGEDMSETEAQQIIDDADKNKDRLMDLKEFHDVMSS